VIAGQATEAPAAAWRSRAWTIVGAFSVTETVSWGVLYYAFAVFPLPMQRDLGYSAAQLTGAFSLSLLVPVLMGIVIGMFTVPLHALVLRAAPARGHDAHRSASAGEALHSPSFRLLAVAFFLGTLAGIAVVVQGTPFVLEDGHGTAFATFAIGLIGASQIPGRALSAALGARVTETLQTTAGFALITAGILLIVAGADAHFAVLAAVVGYGAMLVTLAGVAALAAVLAFIAAQE
jgi:hypothetical protein